MFQKIFLKIVEQFQSFVSLNYEEELIIINLNGEENIKNQWIYYGEIVKYLFIYFVIIEIVFVLRQFNII